MYVYQFIYLLIGKLYFVYFKYCETNPLLTFPSSEYRIKTDIKLILFICLHFLCCVNDLLSLQTRFSFVTEKLLFVP